METGRQRTAMVVRLEGIRWLTGSRMRARTRPGRAACSKQANAGQWERSPALVIAMEVVEVSLARAIAVLAGVDNPGLATVTGVEETLPTGALAREEATGTRIVAAAETASAIEVFLRAAVVVVLSVVAARVAAHGPAAPVVHPAWEEAPVAVAGAAAVDAGGNATIKIEEKLCDQN